MNNKKAAKTKETYSSYLDYLNGYAFSRELKLCIKNPKGCIKSVANTEEIDF